MVESFLAAFAAKSLLPTVGSVEVCCSAKPRPLAGSCKWVYRLELHFFPDFALGIGAQRERAAAREAEKNNRTAAPPTVLRRVARFYTENPR